MPLYEQKHFIKFRKIVYKMCRLFVKEKEDCGVTKIIPYSVTNFNLDISIYIQ